jgi:hypothetical protein
MPDSIILNKLLETTTENTIEYLKQQQREIKKQLMEQEVLNKSLYESILKYGFPRNEATIATTVPSIASSTSLLDSLKQKFNLLTTAASNTAAPSAPVSNINSLTSLLPFGDMLSGIGSVFQKLFGSEYWVYWLLAILISLLFTIITCCCIYCCCCSRIGRSLMCCCKCGGFSSSSSKKKKLNNDSIKSKFCF